MVKRLIGAFFAFILAGCAVGPESLARDPVEPPAQTPVQQQPGVTQAQKESQPVRANLEDLGPAPELENGVWLNTDQPLRLADLRGKVVLIDMWTFG